MVFLLYCADIHKSVGAPTPAPDVGHKLSGPDTIGARRTNPDSVGVNPSAPDVGTRRSNCFSNHIPAGGFVGAFQERTSRFGCPNASPILGHHNVIIELKRYKMNCVNAPENCESNLSFVSAKPHRHANRFLQKILRHSYVFCALHVNTISQTFYLQTFVIRCSGNASTRKLLQNNLF